MATDDLAVTDCVINYTCYSICFLGHGGEFHQYFTVLPSFSLFFIFSFHFSHFMPVPRNTCACSQSFHLSTISPAPIRAITVFSFKSKRLHFSRCSVLVHYVLVKLMSRPLVKSDFCLSSATHSIFWSFPPNPLPFYSYLH